MTIQFSKIFMFMTVLNSVNFCVCAQTQMRMDSTGSKKTILPKPYATPSVVNNSNVVGWVDGKQPTAPAGFKVTRFADGFESPRWIYASPNGDIFICESSTKPSSANRITILQDSDKDGTYDSREIFLSNQNKPFGMLVLDSFF